jgi:microcin C transport system permease protein
VNIGTYVLRRLLLAIPTLLGITLVCFFIINMAPGGPIEQQLQAIRFGGGMSGEGGTGGESGVNEKIIEMMKEYYGFDKPLLHRYFIWLKNIVTLDFGRSYSYEMPVWELIKARIPISLQFGLSSLILTYLVSVLLGVLKAVKNGSKFDVASSTVLFVLYSIPSLILGIILIVFVAGRDGSWFPLGGVVSDYYSYLSFWEKVGDRIRHFILPLLCYMVGSFTFLTLLMKNSMLDVINMDYVRTARAKGLDNKKVILKHAFRNALIPMVTGMTGILTVFFAGSIIVEQIFNINGMGLLSYQALLSRDYPVIMALIFIQSVLYLSGRLLVDLLYTVIDPRINFS